MEPLAYCSYFDHRYLARALCLYESLRAWSPPFKWYVLALSSECVQLLDQLRLDDLYVVTPEQLESTFPTLKEAKSNRTTIEYYFTLTPALVKYTLSQNKPNTWNIYLDSDLYFFGSPVPILDELADSSVGIIAHNFSAENAHRINYGKFNVGWVSFRQDSAARACVEDWYNRCVEWCYDKVEPHRFADQKYLDVWPENHVGVKTISHAGANLAPWNIADFPLAKNGAFDAPSREDGLPVIFAHFQGLRKLSSRTFETALDEYQVPHRLRPRIARQLYRPYLSRLIENDRKIAKMLGRSEKEIRSPRFLWEKQGKREMLKFPFKYLDMVRRYNWIRA